MASDRETRRTPSSEVALRPANPSDEPFLLEMLLLAAFPPDAAAPPADRVRDGERLGRYVAGWGRPGDAGVIAESPEEPIGAAWYRHFSRETPGHGFVAEAIPELSIAVKPAWRGRGVGSALLRALMDEARRKRRVGLSLSVSRRNPVALRLYESMGFRAVAGDAEHPTMLLDLS